ncbi:calcium-binding protein [Cupriavidus pinatubonensis]|uniref:calcium-binding protein n=1 Tax=Cupriavidus pinatubonensis TaxID=248026 RepID=UPI001CC75EB0|nr:calcium-binding protein [Cupriavidus pinatubonensis]
MAKPSGNQHEQRISMEIVVDAYTEEECAMAWYCVSVSGTRVDLEVRLRQVIGVVVAADAMASRRTI